MQYDHIFQEVPSPAIVATFGHSGELGAGATTQQRLDTCGKARRRALAADKR